MSIWPGLIRLAPVAGFDVSEREYKMQEMSSVGGLSKARLGRMHDIMAGHVDSGHLPGLVALVSRHGEVHVDVIGKAAFSGAPLSRLRPNIFSCSVRETRSQNSTSMRMIRTTW